MALRREEVVAGALELLDEVGLDQLTMRRLAQALGVQAGAIYWHFKNKQELIDAMYDAMLVGLAEPPPTGSWQEQLAELMRRSAALLLARRDGARLATQVLRPGENALKGSERMMQALRGSKLPQETALWASSVFGYFVLGYVTDIQATEEAKQRGLLSAVREFRETLDEEKFPELAKISEATIEDLLKMRNAQRRFEFGLDMIMRGLEAMPPRRPPRPRRRRRRVIVR